MSQLQLRRRSFDGRDDDYENSCLGLKEMGLEDCFPRAVKVSAQLGARGCWYWILPEQQRQTAEYGRSLGANSDHEGDNPTFGVGRPLCRRRDHRGQQRSHKVASLYHTMNLVMFLPPTVPAVRKLVTPVVEELWSKAGDLLTGTCGCGRVGV